MGSLQTTGALGIFVAVLLGELLPPFRPTRPSLIKLLPSSSLHAADGAGADNTADSGIPQTLFPFLLDP